MSIIII
ncbi:hypothetical protein VTL71DRAFT_3662 [Oculimacula yallundae]